ncbi:hypothetical protein NDU88_007404 [Pleurodeles waltl]|uniref:Uncharacterized protein n=1 Tax=Pleurodeles waltl TaxID=8319 RepID=A0AAV7N471_PLEWA|nr:hypothetical protein NDU88_007404 [Pleurodeles waltl]
MTRHFLMRESETIRQRYVLKKKQRKNKVTLFASEQDTVEQDKKWRAEENPLHQMQAVADGLVYLKKPNSESVNNGSGNNREPHFTE